MKLTKIGEFLLRSKIPVDIEDDLSYTRVTIRINHNGVSKRDTEKGSKIGTKKQFYLKAGQFIVSKIDARYGAFGIAPDEVDNAIITGNFWAFDVDNSKVNIEWFNQFTNSPSFYDICERASSGITHRKYLDEKFFLNYEINLPSIDEQLVQIQDIKKQKQSFGRLSDELTHQLTLVKQLRQSFLREAMQGKLTADFRSAHPELIKGENSAQALLEKITAEKKLLIKDGKLKKEKELAPIGDDEIPFKIPDGWVWCRLGEIVSEIKYGTSQSCDYDASKNSAVLRIPNISSGIINCDDLKYTNLSESEKNELALLENDLLLIRSNGSKELVGMTVLVTPHFSGLAFAGYLIRLRFNNKYIESKFILQTTKSTYLREQIESPLRTTVGINNINTTEISNLLLVLPPLSEQQAIVSKLDELMRTCDELEASIRTSQQQNEMLLREVLREALEG